MINAEVLDSAHRREAYNPRCRSFFRDLFAPRFGVLVFSFGLFVFYVMIPLVVYFIGSNKVAYLLLAQIGFVSIISIAVGYLTPLTDSRFRFGALRFVIDGRLFNRVLWAFFIVFMVLVLCFE